MRVSTNQIYDQNIRSIMDNQRGLVQTQQELSTGKKINRPSDDPIGAAKVIRYTEELDQLKQYQRNLDLLRGSLEQQDAVLGNIGDAAQRARVLAIRAGSGIVGPSDKQAIASELKQIRDEILDLMNAQDADGNYLYSGNQSGINPFSLNPASLGNKITFNGDGGSNQIQVADSATIQGTTSGFDVFENVLARKTFSASGATLEGARVSEQSAFDTFFDANYDPVVPANNAFRLTMLAGNTVELTNVATGTVIGTSAYTPTQPFRIRGMEFTMNGGVGDTVDFSLDPPQKKNLAETINDLYEALNDPGTSDSGFDEALQDAIVGIDNGMEKLLRERSSVGGRMNAATAVYETNLDLEINAKQSRSTIQDTDFAEASIEFSKQETALNAALASFPRVANLSLFNFI